jgi:nucleotide-binding universal stress UspA family protein
MPKNVAPLLVGTDLGGAADDAIRQAAAWAAKVGASLLVVHVAPDEVFRALEAPKVVDALTKNVQALTASFGVRAEVRLEAGSAHAVLLQTADTVGAGAIVIGASHRSDLGQFVFSSTAEQVVRHAHCPVLVVREASTGPVVCATDFSDAASAALGAAIEQARLRGVGVRLVHVVFDPVIPTDALGPLVISAPQLRMTDMAEVRAAAEGTLRTQLQAANTDGTYAVLQGSPGRAIVEDATAAGASLVVVATRGRTGLARIALGSVAEYVVRHAASSVLAVRRGPDV